MSRIGTMRKWLFRSDQGRTQRVSKGSFPLFRIAALSGVAVLLVVVGTLQYRWNTQIKKAAEVRMGADLESVMMKWHLDLYGEFSAICVALQVGPDSGGHDRWDDYLQRYSEWSRSGNSHDSVENIYTNRDLIRDIYIWETSKRTAPRLLRLDADARAIEEAVTPSDLQTLLTLLQRHSSSLRVALRAWELDSPSFETRASTGNEPAPSLRSNAITGWQFDEQVPAIVHPIFHRTQRGTTPVEASNNGEAVDWVVVVLNLETIQTRILPQLTQRYFGGVQGLDYRLALFAAGTRPRLLYSSDPGFGPNNINASDSVMNIFGPPPESTEGHFWQTEKNRESLRGEDWHSFSGPVWFPIVQHTASDGPWMLALQNRKGPLDAAVTKVWRSNLFIGGVVLLLLSASMVLVTLVSQRAQALADLQMEFVASVSHELRTPLAAVLSAGQNLTDGFVPDPKQYGSIITSQTRQLIDLVDQILLFASMKDHKENYHLHPMDVTEVLDNARKNAIATFQQLGFTIDFQVHGPLPEIMGDARLLSRCLQNLISNAVKYSGGIRRIEVSANCEELETFKKEVLISIKDQGIGVSDSELGQIFEPFYRSPSVVAAQIHGTGLGLAVTKQLIEAMGGRITVISEPGMGSVFTLHLPVAEESVIKRTASFENGVTAQ